MGYSFRLSSAIASALCVVAACGLKNDLVGAAGAGTSTASGSGQDCTQVCTDLYHCGLAKDAKMAQYCPGFKGGAELDTWLNGSMMDGCVLACADQTLASGTVDKNDCAKTVSTLQATDATFKCVCAKGLAMTCP